MRTTAAGCCRWLSRAAVVASVLVFAFLVVGPHTGRYRTLTVLTASMRPTIPPGSVIVVRPTPVEDLRVGDIVTYSAPLPDHRLVTHRVVKVVRPGVVQTRGDANNTPDPWLAELKGATIWKVQGQVPGLGYLIETLRSPVAHALTVVLTLVIGVAAGLRAIWRRPALA